MEAQQREMGQLRYQEGQLDYHRRSRGGQIGDKGTVESSRRGSSSRRPSGDTYDYSNFSGDGYDDFSRGGTEYHDGYVGDDGHSYYSDRDGGSIYDIEGQEHQHCTSTLQTTHHLLFASSSQAQLSPSSSAANRSDSCFSILTPGVDLNQITVSNF
jgi:hypothetical protein